MSFLTLRTLFLSVCSLVPAALYAPGCDADAGPSESTRLCREQFAVERGFSLDGDGDTCEPSPECGTAAHVEAQCADEGHPCEVRVTREAALCIAEAEGLPEGVAPWSARLVYHHGFETAVWNVASTREQDGLASKGVSFALDAATGEWLGESHWQMTP